jgi:hypothetical protein
MFRIATIFLIMGCGLTRPAEAAYQYYVDDYFPSIDASRWISNGTVAGGTQGLTGYYVASGSVVSRIAVPDGTSNYEAQMTVHLNSANQTGNSVYAVMARASADARMGVSAVPLSSTGTFYAFAMVNPWYTSYTGMPGFGWSATMYVLKVVNGSSSILAQFPYAVHDTG